MGNFYAGLIVFPKEKVTLMPESQVFLGGAEQRVARGSSFKFSFFFFPLSFSTFLA
jgi:hypothetical protein